MNDIIPMLTLITTSLHCTSELLWTSAYPASQKPVQIELYPWQPHLWDTNHNKLTLYINSEDDRI